MISTHHQQALDFLDTVWGKGDAYVDLPSKVNGRWIPFMVNWPANGLASRRIASCVDDGEDIYFSVATFAEPRRSQASALPTHWLWADLDDATPQHCGDLGFLPTIAWSSSPGRYQALWRLKQRLQPRLQSAVNRALTHAVGADPGGWDITQVLRIPGTRNYKYGNPDGAAIKVLWTDGPVHDVGAVHRALVKTGAVLSTSTLQPSPTVGESDARGLVAPSGDLVAGLPVRARRLLRAKEAVVGERSARLWELECLLVEANLSDDEILTLVWSSVWAEKWRERSEGERLCRQEIEKARMSVDKKRHLSVVPSTPDPLPSGDPDDRPSLPWEGYGDFLSKNFEAPRWLIEDIWTANSHGIVGGEPKTSKTTLMLAMAVSVASGQPFLGQYNVGVSGPVLFVQEENAPWVVQDRLRKIAASYGLIRATTGRAGDPALLGDRVVTSLDFPDDLPIRLLNNFGFDLGEEEHREMLEASVSELRPALVVIDPLYLVVGSANTDSGTEMRPFLKWLLYLRYTYGCAIALVHHMSKYTESHKGRRMGQRLAGTHVFHGWLDCGLYTAIREGSVDSTLKLKVDREFRSVGSKAPWNVDLTIGDPGDLTFEVKAGESNEPLRSPLHVLVENAGRKGLTLKLAAESMRVDKRTALRRIQRMPGLSVRQSSAGSGSRTWRVYLLNDPVEPK